MIDYTLQLPTNEEAENAVLGSLILETDKIVLVANILKKEMFSSYANQIIYETIIAMHEKGQVIDMLTITEEIKKSVGLKAVGGAYHISKLTSYVASAAHIEDHAEIIKGYYLRREIIFQTDKIMKWASDMSFDLNEVIDKIQSFQDQIHESIFSNNQILTYQQRVSDFISKASNPDKEQVKDPLVPSFRTLQPYISTYEPGRLLVIAGRPSMGKSALVLNEFFHLAKQHQAVLFFSLEMTAEQLVKRTLMRETGFHGNQISTCNFDKDQWQYLDATIGKIEGADLFIDDSSDIDVSHIRIVAKNLIIKHDIRAIAIDYLQLLKTDERLPRERQVAIVTRQLKNLARELKLPIFLLAQLNRGVEARSKESYIPKLADLRESGAVEQDADIVMFPFRPEYYYKKIPEFKDRGLLIIAKNRDGRVGSIPVKIEHYVNKWSDSDNPIENRIIYENLNM